MAIVLFAVALMAMWWFQFDPFAVHDAGDAAANTLPIAAQRSLVALLIGALIVLGGFFPAGGRRPDRRPFFSRDRPTQINYTQGYVQFCVVAPLMAVALLVASILWAQATGRPGVTSLATFTEYSALVTQAWKFWPFHLSIVFVSFWLLAFFAVASRREPRRIATALAVPLVVVPVLHALLAAIVLIFQQFPQVGGEWMAFVWGPVLVAMAFVLSIVVLIGMLGRDSTDGVREWWSRLGAWLAIYATTWMVISVSAVRAQVVAWAFEYANWKTFTGLAGWVATVAGGLMAGHSPATGGRAKGPAVKAEGTAGADCAVRLHRRCPAGGVLRHPPRDRPQRRQRLVDRRLRAAGDRSARDAGGVSRGDHPAGRARRHQRVQPQCVLPQSPGALPPRSHPRRGRPEPAELHGVRRQG